MQRRRLRLEPLENRCVPAADPVLVVPGFGGSLPPDGAFVDAVYQLGFDPARAEINNFEYGAILDSLRAVGYRDGVDLFAATYDWRLPIAPPDGTRDGRLANVTAASLTDDVYASGVDYLGYWLRQAAEAWVANHPGQPLQKVDLITHSEGGIVSRAYVQSAAYGGTFVAGDGRVLPLPRVDTYLQIASPNYGTVNAWDYWANNFQDIFEGPVPVIATRAVLEPLYQSVVDGRTIDGPTPITRATITDPTSGEPDPQRFLHQYITSAGQMVATYDFVILPDGSRVGVTNQLGIEPLLPDLNGGPDPNAFADRVGSVAITYGRAVDTLTYSEEHVGGPALLYDVGTGFHRAGPFEVWYSKVLVPQHGDGIIPLESTETPFLNDPRITLYPRSDPAINHYSILEDATTLSLINQLLAGATTAPTVVTAKLRGGQTVVRGLDPTSGAEVFRLTPFMGFRGGVSATTGDVTGDGVADVIVSAGRGGGPHVKVYDGLTRTEVRSFFAFEPTARGGVTVEARDVNGDGFADLIARTGRRVSVFGGRDGALLPGVFVGPDGIPDDPSAVPRRGNRGR